MMEEYWTTKDGTKLNIKDMETSHIRNCIKMLNKLESFKAISCYEASAFSNGEIASEILEQEGNRLLEEGDDDIQDQIYVFEAELRQRGEIK